MRIFYVLFFALVPWFSFAATVTVSMAQNREAPPVALEMTRVIEDQIMNDYFSAGEIISNTEIAENGGAEFRKPAFGLEEAAGGMSDFLLAVYLEYSAEEKKLDGSGMPYALLQKVSWRVVDVPDGRILGSGAFALSESDIQRSNPYDCARVAAGLISGEGLKTQHERGGEE